MKLENTYSSVSTLFSKQFNLSDFGFEKPTLKKIKEINKDIKPNNLLEFIKYLFKYSKIILNKYSIHFSNYKTGWDMKFLIFFRFFPFLKFFWQQFSF